MEYLFDLYGSFPYYIDKSEMSLALAQSGSKVITMLSPEGLINFTKINDQIEGWLLCADNNPHPVGLKHYLFEYTNDHRFCVGDARQDPGLAPIKARVAILSLQVETYGDRAEVSVMSPQMDVGIQRIGGVSFPCDESSTIFNSVKHLPSSLYKVVIKRLPLSLFGGRVAARIVCPFTSGASVSDPIKQAAFPGAGVTIFHNEGFFYPINMDLANPLPALLSMPNIEIGTYDLSGVWTLITTVTGVLRFHQFGALTPQQIFNLTYPSSKKLYICDERESLSMSGYYYNGLLDVGAYRDPGAPASASMHPVLYTKV